MRQTLERSLLIAALAVGAALLVAAHSSHAHLINSGASLIKNFSRG